MTGSFPPASVTPASPIPVSPDDLGRFAEIREVVLSAEADWVAVATSIPDVDTNRYDNRVVVASVDGGSRTEVTAGGPAALPRWSPLGARLAVVSYPDDTCSVQVHDVVTGTSTLVVEGWPDPIEELCWSPDGAWLLFVVREPVDRAYWATPDRSRPPLRLRELRYLEDGIGWLVGRPRQAYLVAAGGGTPMKLSRGGFDDAEFAWHPDSGSVYFVSQRQPDRDRTVLNDVFRQRVAADGTPAGEPEQLTATDLGYSAPRPGPDGTTVAVAAVDVLGYPAATHLGVVDGSGPFRDLTGSLDRDCVGSSAIWVDDHRIWTLVDDSGSTGIVEFDTAAGTTTQIVGGRRRVTAFDTVGGVLAYAVSGPVEPPRAVVRHSDGTEREVVAPNANLVGSRILRAPRLAAVPVAAGVDVDSWLVRPDAEVWPGARPMIVWLQGGGTAYGYQWSHEVQALCAAGFAVLYLNARGSAGYGTDWMRVVSGQDAATPGTGWGVDDIADVAAVVRATLAGDRGIDPGRVGVMGGSYGGLVVTHLLAQTDLFRAGWAERGPYNLFSDAGTKDEAPWFFGAYLGRSHLEDPAAYWAASPLRLVEQITDPLMIVHSEEDRRCAVQQAEELFMALKLLGREVEFVRFPGESHGLTRSGSPVHRLQRLEILLEWFGRWLEPGEPTAVTIS